MEATSLAWLAAGLGAGLGVIGAGLGIGRLASSAMEGMARQPQAAADIRIGLIIAAARTVSVTTVVLTAKPNWAVPPVDLERTPITPPPFVQGRALP